MVKTLRRKFVVITTLMMVILFGAVWSVNKINIDRWADEDVLYIIELLTDSGVLFGEEQIDDELLVESLTAEEPIYGILVGADGTVKSRQDLGTTQTKKQLTDKTIQKMCQAPEDDYKVDGYIFTKRSIEGGDILIVAINSVITDNSVKRWIANGVLAACGFGMLVLISFYLSRFITEPAEKALEREKRFISDASHELKTPLGAIGVNAQALELNGNDSMYVRNIIFETARMGRLIERLLTLSKLEENELVVKEPFSLSLVTEEMMLSYESIAFEKNRQLSYRIEPNLQMKGSIDEMRQLLAILIDNAIKNSEENSIIAVQCNRVVEGIRLQVTNNGKGIRPEDLEHIFERFYTTDTSRTSSSFGLGLAIAKEIVERHGGKIQVDSEPGQETVFTVTFS